MWPCKGELISLRVNDSVSIAIPSGFDTSLGRASLIKFAIDSKKPDSRLEYKLSCEFRVVNS